MGKIIMILLLCICSPSLLALDLTASSVVLMDYHSREVLYSKGAHVRRPPASTTKVMTAILALELGDLSQGVMASPQASSTGGSSIYLEEGEVLTLEELIWGLLLNSGNDAAVAIAEHIGGSVEGFAYMMNMKAFSLGAINTSFLNPHGLPQEGHLTTAFDLALITRYAMENPIFSHMVGTREHRIPLMDQEQDRYLHNSNGLLSHYPYADGVKTGWTSAAGRCLIASAKKGDRRLISVTLNSPEMYQDNIALLEYGFRNFQTIELVKKGEFITGIQIPNYPGLMVTLITGSHLFHSFLVGDHYSIKKSIVWRDDLQLPLVQGQPVAWLQIFKDEKPLGRIPLLLSTPIETPPFWKRIWNYLIRSFHA